jgi:L-arabinokinase
VTIVFYISGHGFGHASRCIELANVLIDRSPEVRVEVRSQVAPWLLRHAARPSVTVVPVQCDTGIAQIDSLRLDERATVSRACAFMETWTARVDAERQALRSAEARLVVADIPPLGIAAARAAGVPAVALGNFSWDWAYAAYEGAGDLAARIADVYATATLALRLPMWGGFDAFPRIVDLPFIARRSRRDPDEVRRHFGFPANTPLVLVSFGGHGVDGLDLELLSRLPGYGVVVSASVPIGPSGRRLGDTGPRGGLIPLDETAMYRDGFQYEDIVRAVDAVMTKPGYGIIAECLANDTALVYTSRGHFIEYDVLVSAMPRFLRCGFIGHDDFFASRWTPTLDRVLAQPAPLERPPTNGADAAADLLLGHLA